MHEKTATSNINYSDVRSRKKQFMRPWLTFYRVKGNTASLPKNTVREKLEDICESEEIKISNNFFLKKSSSNDPKSGDFWDLLNDTGEHIGEFCVGTHYDSNTKARIPWIRSSLIYKKYRGNGLGRLAMKKLVQYYKILRSDLTGTTNDEAEKAWQAIGAKRLSHKNRKHLDFSDYVISHSKIKESQGKLSVNQAAKLLTLNELEKITEEWWHGSPSGQFKGHYYGIHVGTKKAARQALEAKVGVKADGSDWDGTQEYGKTLLAGKMSLRKIAIKRGLNSDSLITGYSCDAPEKDFYPGDIEYKACYSDRSPIPLDCKPDIFEVELTGKFSNSVSKPMSDIQANSRMMSLQKRNKSRRGYYYHNDAEDYSSISAVVPGNGDVKRLKNESQGKIFKLANLFHRQQWIAVISPAILNSPENPNKWPFRISFFSKTLEKDWTAEDHTYLDSNDDEIVLSNLNLYWPGTSKWIKVIKESQGKLSIDQAAKLLTLNEQDKIINLKLDFITSEYVETLWKKLNQKMSQEKLNDRLMFWKSQIENKTDEVMKALAGFNVQLDLGELDKGNTTKLISTDTDKDVYTHWNEISFNGP